MPLHMEIILIAKLLCFSDMRQKSFLYI